jgi:hypothetical protein
MLVTPLLRGLTRTLGIPWWKRCGVRTLADHRGIRLLSVNSSHRRVLLPARLPSQPTISAHPLDPSESTSATCWPVPPLSSPKFEHPRPRHHRPTAAARRRHLRSILRHPSITGEPNCCFPSLVCLPRLTSPPASSPSPSVPGEGKARAWLWRFKNVQGPEC